MQCPYCNKAIGGQEISRDHIWPRSKGGPDHSENIRFVCRSCNQLRQMAGECVGVLFCAKAVAERPPYSNTPRYTRQVRKILRQWKLMQNDNKTL